MKLINILLIGITLIILTLTCACSNSSNFNASLGQQIQLPLGQSVAIDDEGLSIKFENVSEDSRCPTGVTCVWAGEAKCQTTIVLNGSSDSLILTISGSSDTPTEFKGYIFTANLEPYPQAEQTIDKNSYILVLKVTK